MRSRCVIQTFILNTLFYAGFVSSDGVQVNFDCIFTSQARTQRGWGNPCMVHVLRLVGRSTFPRLALEALGTKFVGYMCSIRAYSKLKC